MSVSNLRALEVCYWECESPYPDHFMFPLQEFDTIFDKIQNKYPDWHFGDLTWSSIRDLTLAYCVRKFHLKKSAQPLEKFLKGMIQNQILGRFAASKHFNNSTEKKIYYAETADNKYLWNFWATRKQIKNIIGQKGRIIHINSGRQVGKRVYSDDGQVYTVGNYINKTILTPANP